YIRRGKEFDSALRRALGLQKSAYYPHYRRSVNNTSRCLTDFDRIGQKVESPVWIICSASAATASHEEYETKYDDHDLKFLFVFHFSFPPLLFDSQNIQGCVRNRQNFSR